MKILLINPAIRVNQPACEFPLGLGYIAAVLKQKGHQITILDMNARHYRPQEFIAELKNHLLTTDWIGMGGLVTTYKTQCWIVGQIRHANFTGPIVLGGGLASSEYEILLDDLDIDVCVLGEGEQAAAQLATVFQNQTPEKLTDIKNIAWKNRTTGHITVNDPEAPIKNLDDLPHPAWELFDTERYIQTYYHGQLRADTENLKEMVLFTSRGCPYKCNFCYHLFGYQYRYRTVDSIFNEIETFQNQYSQKLHVRFLDDCFVVNKNRLTEFCDRMISEKRTFTWSCMGRANICDRSMLRLMKQAGCLYVGYGLESGNETILKQVIGKAASVKQNIQAVKNTLKEGMATCPTIMTNQPGENEQTIRDTVSMVQKIGTSCSKLFYACPYPGTPLWNYAANKNLIPVTRREFLEIVSDKDVNQLIVNLTDLPDKELIRLHDQAEQDIAAAKRKLTVQKIVKTIRKEGLKWTLNRTYRKLTRTTAS